MQIPRGFVYSVVRSLKAWESKSDGWVPSYPIIGSFFTVNTDTQRMIRFPSGKEETCVSVLYEGKILLVPVKYFEPEYQDFSWLEEVKVAEVGQG